jgi:hypothetical protein
MLSSAQYNVFFSLLLSTIRAKYSSFVEIEESLAFSLCIRNTDVFYNTIIEEFIRLQESLYSEGFSLEQYNHGFEIKKIDNQNNISNLKIRHFYKFSSFVENEILSIGTRLIFYIDFVFNNELNSIKFGMMFPKDFNNISIYLREGWCNSRQRKDRGAYSASYFYAHGFINYDLIINQVEKYLNTIGLSSLQEDATKAFINIRFDKRISTLQYLEEELILNKINFENKVKTNMFIDEIKFGYSLAFEQNSKQDFFVDDETCQVEDEDEI